MDCIQIAYGLHTNRICIAGHMDCGGEHEKQGLVNLGLQVEEKLLLFQLNQNSVSIKQEYYFNQIRILFE